MICIIWFFWHYSICIQEKILSTSNCVYPGRILETIDGLNPNKQVEN